MYRLLYVSVFLSGDRYLGGGATDVVKFVLMVKRCDPDVASPVLVAIFLGVSKCGVINAHLRHRFLPIDREYLENCKSQRYMSIKT